MPKIGFRRLSRGVRLLTDHIHTQVQKALDRSTDTGFTADNLQSSKARTRVSFSWSDIQPGLTPAPGVTNTKGILQALFAMPPTQDKFSGAGQSGPGDSSIILDAITLGFDQRSEAAAILADGSLDFPGADKLGLKLSILAKTPWIYGGGVKADTKIAQLEYDPLAFSSSQFLQNPIISSGLGIIVDPYKTMMLQIDLTSLQGAASELVLNSLVVSLDFYSDLVQRDSIVSDNWELQNVPTTHLGKRVTLPETLTVPPVGSIITADSAAYGDGVQGALEKADRPLHEGLVGGYGDKSAPNGVSNILTDAGYEVVAVPMWGNGWDTVTTVAGPGPDLAYLPFMGESPYEEWTCDRRVIPIQFPMVVHHVLAATHYEVSVPGSKVYDVEIGVGLGCGIRSDLFESRQLAHARWNSSNEIDYLVDTFSAGNIASLYNIPLVHITGQEGTGYPNNSGSSMVATGTPVFCGQALSSEQPRTDMAPGVGAAAGVTPLMHGKEQFIEVRWAFRDSLGLANMPLGEGPIGFGGHWVYIIGKKHIC